MNANFILRVKPEWLLRVGLGLVYLYSGFDLFYHPDHWYGFVPHWFSGLLPSFFPLSLYLRAQGVAELFLGFLFIGWFAGRRSVLVASAVSALELFLILIFVGVDPITFRDIGLFAAALALFIIVSGREKKPEENKNPRASV